MQWMTRRHPGLARYWPATTKSRPESGFALWLALWRERRQLAELDSNRLRDLGLTRTDVEAECSKPFWRRS
jgi:uncharacterized protein YjiS (DUF1127 family)